MLDSLFHQLDKLKRKSRPWIPFTSLNTVWRHIDPKSKTILDVGSGKGEPLQFINRKHRYFAVGLDAFEPYLKQCQKEGTYHSYVQADVRLLPFADNSFDSVLCLEVLEHLEREDGEKLLKEMERVATTQVILSTPVGNYKQDVFDGNPHQEHKYMWDPREMKAKGFRVKGIGLRNLSGKAGVQSPHSRPVQWLVNILWVLTSPLTYFSPKMSGDMVCIKSLSK
jgi:2-polyprenyl-3-methyl-5-hydroxy-6-metoxy-1,4-benzoquinol methylase